MIVVQGQFAIPLLSDPYGGLGSPWHGRLPAEPQRAEPNTTWYSQVACSYSATSCGLMVAHDRAVALSPSPQVALRTQYAMLTLMVLYTVGGMWLLSLN